MDSLLPWAYLHVHAYRKGGKFIESICFTNIFSGESSVCRLPTFKSVNGQPLLAGRVYFSHRFLLMDCTTSHQKHHKIAFLYNSFTWGYSHLVIYNICTRNLISLPVFQLNLLDGCQVSNRKYIVSSLDTKKPTCRGLAIQDGHHL